VGGRVQTETYEGFLLDHGFQVYLPSYEMGKYFFNYKDLELKSFSAGAKVFYDGAFQSMSDPLREPAGFISTLSNQLGSLKDKILILKLKLRAASFNKVETKAVSTLEYLKDFGFSKKFISTFFKPFFSGIFLEKELATSSSFFLYLFDKFAKSEASVPKNGMKALSEQLASQLGNNRVFLNSKVTEVSQNTIKINEGSQEKYDHVVLAATPDITNKLLGTEFKTFFNATQTYYFKTESKDFSDKKLFLNSNDEKKVNHIACMSAVSKAYAPNGWELFSVTTVGPEDHSLDAVKSDLEKLFGKKEINTWQHLKTYKIHKALPGNPLYSKTALKKDGVFICGDFTTSPSIQGALSSGYQVAKEMSKLS